MNILLILALCQLADDTPFTPCNLGAITEYYRADTHYQGGLRAIRRFFREHSPKTEMVLADPRAPTKTAGVATSIDEYSNGEVGSARLGDFMLFCADRTGGGDDE